ncbi:MAG: biopolymer transporter Tol [Silvibacterium sp.]|nr:biopolymer transporter Tol [Silvibacterium sp.]
MKFDRLFLPVFHILASALFMAPRPAEAQSAPPVQTGSAAYLRPDSHQPSRNFSTPIGAFDGQSDIGIAQVEGSALYDPVANQYTIHSAGYNTTYPREEFRFLWKKMSGDVAITAEIAFPDPEGYDGRKAVLAIRQGLEDDSKEVLVGVYGTGVFSLSQRPCEGKTRRDETYRVWGVPAHVRPDKRAVLMPRRLALEKHGDAFILYVSIEGEPMHPFGSPLILHLDQPFYVGIGFCSNLPDKSDTAIFSNVAVETLPRPSGTPTP